MRLTDIRIRSLKIPESGAVVYPDDHVSGFGVRVSEGGTKSFVLTHGPRRQCETIGRVGVLSLHDTRAEAKRRLAEYTLGKARPKIISGVSAWTLHDLRRTFASSMASIGVQLPVVERLLNHVSGSFGGIVGVYQRYDFMPEMRDAISRWEEHIQSLST